MSISVGTKIFDVYLRLPLLWDILTSSIFVFISVEINRNILHQQIKIESINKLSDSVGTNSVSLAGFIFASLSVILAFKDFHNMQKGKKGAALFFNNNKAYGMTVRMFLYSTFILFGCFILNTLIDLCKDLFSLKLYTMSIFFLLFIMGLTVFRSLYLLFKIIKLQINS